MPESLLHAFLNLPAPALFLQLSRTRCWGDDDAAPASEWNHALVWGCRGCFPPTLMEENCVLPISEVSCTPGMKHLNSCYGDNWSISAMARHSVLLRCTPASSQSSQWFPLARTG